MKNSLFGFLKELSVQTSRIEFNSNIIDKSSVYFEYLNFIPPYTIIIFIHVSIYYCSIVQMVVYN